MKAKGIVDQIEKAMEGATPGPWYPGHLCDDDHECNCSSIALLSKLEAGR